MTAANPHTLPNRITNPCFSMKISLDRQKYPPYTPSRQKQYLINQFQSTPCRQVKYNGGLIVFPLVIFQRWEENRVIYL
jgi:hypothetical protein